MAFVYLRESKHRASSWCLTAGIGGLKDPGHLQDRGLGEYGWIELLDDRRKEWRN